MTAFSFLFLFLLGVCDYYHYIYLALELFISPIPNGCTRDDIRARLFIFLFYFFFFCFFLFIIILLLLLYFVKFFFMHIPIFFFYERACLFQVLVGYSILFLSFGEAVHMHVQYVLLTCYLNCMTSVEGRYYLLSLHSLSFLLARVFSVSC